MNNYLFIKESKNILKEYIFIFLTASIFLFISFTKSFSEENVLEIGEYLIQKITNQIANHLKESNEFEEELKSIRNIFQLDSNE